MPERFQNPTQALAYLLLLIGSIPKCNSFASSPLSLPHLSPSQRQRLCATDSSTDASFTIPRFFQEETPEGSYPSPLHTIHVKSLLTEEEFVKCQQLAYDYASSTGCWNQPDLERRHSTYSTCDFPIDDNEELATYLHDIEFDERIWQTLQELYQIQAEEFHYLDFFCAHYQARDGIAATKTMDRLEAHRDGSLLSFTVLLNNPSEFRGGGTFFEGLRDVKPDSPILQPGGVIRPPRAGDATFHSGKLLHGADVITQGNRTVLVGFVDVADWVQRPGVLSQACRDWGRMDVADFRYKRQLAKAKDGGGWFLNNARWIHSNVEEGEGRSSLRGFVPAFDSAVHRADPEYQRLRKLEAEDRLLRSILLPESERTQQFEVLDGDITIL